jgi:hydrogenase nickel incorporation protein HypA/HybF
MHEMSVAENILEIVRHNFKQEIHGSVRTITVRVGELAGVVPESLEFCFQAITQGTPFQNASLRIDRIPLEGRCDRCGKTTVMEEVFSPCSHCDNQTLTLLSGRELQVVEFEVSNGKGDIPA